MSGPKKKHNAIIEDYFYACCPFCKTPLTQGKSGTDSFNLCPTCAAYLHVLIEGKRVIVEPKGN